MGLLVSSILTHRLHKGLIASLVGSGLLAGSRMLQIETITPTPLPGVVQIKHGHHLAFTHLHQQVVESCQDGVVIHPWTYLECRLHLGGHTPFAIRAHKDAQVVDADLLHEVELSDQTFAVTTLSFRAQDSAIPEVGTNIIIRSTVLHEMSVFHSHEFRLCHHRQTHRCQQ